MGELLLELFSEEIPARMQKRAADDLSRQITDSLNKQELSFDKVTTYYAPRRITLVIEGLPDAQKDVKEERRGPRADAPEKALAGFLGATGLTREQCEERETPKGTFLFAVIERKGRPTPEVLAEIIPAAMAALPWPKSMRWGDKPLRWVRPLHNILCLFNGAVVPFTFEHLTSNNKVKGHRFMSKGSMAVSNAAEYRTYLENAYVEPDADERRRIIVEDAESLAANEGFTVKDDKGLLEEVTGLVEWPVVLMGKIDDEFMEVPPEVLTTAMRSHQKYFSVLDKDGKLAPRFITVSNLQADDGGEKIIAGNERVLRARLSDAKFFWDQDRKTRLEDRLDDLSTMTFHAKLGNMRQKVERLEVLASTLCSYIEGADREVAVRAAHLAKADLVSGMVFEFPELQGIMGRYYARFDKENEAVANAIATHYSPAGPSDDCPTETTAAIVALADKLDTLAGFFAIDEKPTGSKDPFALRRAALGIIRLILENKLRLPLRALVSAAVEAHRAVECDVNAVVEDIMGFFADRLKVHLKDEGVRHDLIEAIFSGGNEDDLVRLLARVKALDAFINSDDGANLLIAYRRAANIVRIESKKDEKSYEGAVNASLFQQKEETDLHKRLEEVVMLSAAAVKMEDFAAGMKALARLRNVVDPFFDQVTVNCDQADVRINRLQILSQIQNAMDAVADFSQVQGEPAVSKN